MLYKHEYCMDTHPDFRYAKMREMDIVNGIGTRLSVFFQGCSHHCDGCFNPETWSFGDGNVFGRDEMVKVIETLEKPMYYGVSILGGEPFDQPDELWEFMMFLDTLYDEIRYGEYLAGIDNIRRKDIWIWTGYTYEELKNNKKANDILSLTDVLIDGPFMKDRLCPDEKYRGSSNQRVIDIRKTHDCNEIKLYDEEEYKARRWG